MSLYNTESVLRAIESSPGITASDLARKVLPPDNDMFKRSSNQGHGATRGKAAWLNVGAFAARLVKKGFLTHMMPLELWNPGRSYGGWSTGYFVTKKGRELIEKK